MKINLIAAVTLACLALVGCAGNGQLGPAAQVAVGDDPLDGGAINNGNGDVIQ